MFYETLFPANRLIGGSRPMPLVDRIVIAASHGEPAPAYFGAKPWGHQHNPREAGPRFRGKPVQRVRRGNLASLDLFPFEEEDEVAQPGVSVRKTREILRLRFEAGLQERKAAASLSVARSTVQECLRRVREAGLSWPLPDRLDDGALAARQYPVDPVAPGFPLSDFAHIHVELARKRVTRRPHWQESVPRTPMAAITSVFCDQYRSWAATHDAVLRRTDTAGD